MINITLDTIPTFAQIQEKLKKYTNEQQRLIKEEKIDQNPFEQIDDIQLLQYTTNPYYEIPSKGKNLEICNSIKSLALSYSPIDSQFSFTYKKSIEHIQKSIFHLKSDNDKCTLLFALWHRLYCYGLSPWGLSYVWNMDSIILHSKQLSPNQKIDWTFAEAKMHYSSDANSMQSQKNAYSCLLRAQIIGQNTKWVKEGELEKMNLHTSALTALFWGLIPGSGAKGFALSMHRPAFIIAYKYLSTEEKNKHYALYSSLFANYIFDFLVQGKKPYSVDVYSFYLMTLNSIINTPQNRNLIEDNKTLAACNFSLFSYFSNEYSKAQKYSYNNFNRILNKPEKFSNYHFLDQAKRITQLFSLELSDTSGLRSFNTGLVIDSHTYANPLGINPQNWSREDQYDYATYLMNSSVYSIPRQEISYNLYEANLLFTKNIVKKLADQMVLYKDWRNALLLYQKADSLERPDNSIYYSDLGWFGSQGATNITIANLGDENIALNSEKEKLKSDISGQKEELNKLKGIIEFKKDSIDILSTNLGEIKHSIKFVKDSLKIYTDSVGAYKDIVKRERDAKNEATIYMWIAMSVGALAVFFAVVFFIQRGKANKQKHEATIQRDKAEIEASINEYKSRVWQEFGHIPSSAIADTFARLEENGASLVDLNCLNSLYILVDGLFNGLKASSSKLSVKLEDEISLAKEYISYVNSVWDKKIVIDVIEPIPSIEVPPAVILSCVKNAVAHGKLKDSQEGRIKLEFDVVDNYHNLHIYDNGIGFEKEVNSLRDIKKGTGLKNCDFILRYFNKIPHEITCVSFAPTQSIYKTKISLLLAKKWN